MINQFSITKIDGEQCEIINKCRSNANNIKSRFGVSQNLFTNHKRTYFFKEQRSMEILCRDPDQENEVQVLNANSANQDNDHST